MCFSTVTGQQKMNSWGKGKVLTKLAYIYVSNDSLVTFFILFPFLNFIIFIPSPEAASENFKLKQSFIYAANC